MMMCEYPYVKTPGGVKRVHLLLSDDARTASTPFGCGRCLHCRINKAREWTHRLLLEQRLHSDSCFVTLTYNEWHLPEDGKVCKETVQKFMKRLRKRAHPRKLRYYCIGEYGDVSSRPHYHFALFGLDGQLEGSMIKKAWRDIDDEEIGFVYVGDLSKDSARYMTKYITKNLRNEENERLEFMTSSRRPGIGRGFVTKMAEILKKQQGFEYRPINRIKYGKKELALGRYLTDGLNDDLGITEGERNLETWKYQDELFEKVRTDPSSDVYYDKLQKISVGARRQQEKRSRIFRQRGKI